ncbi:hypothetical protein Tco_1241861 [Tanacetum coccineum]
MICTYYSQQTRSLSTQSQNQNWVYRNLKDNLNGVNLEDETKYAISEFFKKFYADLEQKAELIKEVKEGSHKIAKNKVFDLLKANSPLAGKSLTKKEKVELQQQVEEFTLTFKEKDIFPAAPEIAKLLIKKDLPTAKEYLRSRNLNDEDMELVGELGGCTIEALLIHVICTLYKTEKTFIRLATLIDQIERASVETSGLIEVVIASVLGECSPKLDQPFTSAVSVSRCAVVYVNLSLIPYYYTGVPLGIHMIFYQKAGPDSFATLGEKV